MSWHDIPRRRYLTAAGAATSGLLAGCAGGGGDTPTPRVERETVVKERTVVREKTVVKERTPGDLTEMHTIATEGSATIPVYLYGVQNGAWRDHGIDLSVEVAAFGKFVRQIVEGLTKIKGISVPPMVSFMNKGEDITFVGDELRAVNNMFVPADSDIESPADLEGKKVGLPFPNSAATKTFLGLVQDEFGIDLREDPAETRFAAPPILWNLLLDGELDCTGEFTGFTIRGLASDEVRSIFSQSQYWAERTGTPLPITNFTVQNSFLQGDPALVIDFMEGWADALQLFIENADEAITNYGRIAGLTTEGEAQVMKELVENETLFGLNPFLTDEDVESQWKFMQVMRDTGQFEDLIAKDDMFATRSEIEALM